MYRNKKIKVMTSTFKPTLKPTDSGRKVTCKIHGTQIEDAELYYCPEEEMYYVFQNEKGSGSPLSISPKDKGYKYSWYYFDPSKNWISHAVTEFKFKDYEIDFDEVRTLQDIKDVLKALNITIIGSYAEQIKHLLKEKK